MVFGYLSQLTGKEQIVNLFFLESYLLYPILYLTGEAEMLPVSNKIIIINTNKLPYNLLKLRSNDSVVYICIFSHETYSKGIRELFFYV